MSYNTFLYLIWGWVFLGLMTFILLQYITAPYGRHSRKDWGPNIPNKLGWFLMEFPSLLVFILCFLLGGNIPSGASWIFFALYAVHYTNRSIIWPWRTRTTGKEMPLAIALMAVSFNVVNGFINGYYFSAFAIEYSLDWVKDPRFIIGIIVFAAGGVINWWSDQILLDLRKGGKKGYYIPRRGLFNWISCPNFFGEIIQWMGFAILTWSPAALAFALWTLFNLLPRALDHHKWYKETFEEYPRNRKAIIPFLL